MLFIRNQNIWAFIQQNRRTNLLLLLISSLIFYAYYFSPDLSAYLSLTVRWSIWWAVCCLVAWSAMLVLVGYAQVYCKHLPGWLKLSNELIYPFYIFHQTVIVVLGYYIIQWSASIPVKILALLFTSFVVTSAICFFLIYPFNALRLLFGLKLKKQPEPVI